MLQKYWVSQSQPEEFSPLGLGCGVTARSEKDAIQIILTAMKLEQVAAKTLNVKLIKSLDDLEQRHVLPNIGNHFQRGIWFPLGFS